MNARVAPPQTVPLQLLAHLWLAVSDMAYTHYLICSILFVDYFILFAIRRFSICLFLCLPPIKVANVNKEAWQILR